MKEYIKLMKKVLNCGGKKKKTVQKQEKRIGSFMDKPREQIQMLQ